MAAIAPCRLAMLVGRSKPGRESLDRATSAVSAVDRSTVRTKIRRGTFFWTMRVSHSPSLILVVWTFPDGFPAPHG